ncbi:MAG: 3-hydroxyacyl-CoA dehydrogenase family protein, partial [Candidatus Hodarchaeales archaeon]
MVAFAKKSTKDPVVSKDNPGFIVNRINAITMLFIDQMLNSKEYEPAAIDATGMMMGMKMGPYELMDFVGLDIVTHSMNYISERLNKDFAPSPTL